MAFGKAEQRLVLRARIVLSAARGGQNRDIARELGTREATVSKWRSRFHQAGLKGLQDKPRPGKPSKYTPSTGVQAADGDPPSHRAHHPASCGYSYLTGSPGSPPLFFHTFRM